jgi:hypothetical protein
MKTIALILGTIALMGCSSGAEYFAPNIDATTTISDGGSDVVSNPDHHADATIKEASTDSDGCVPMIGSWPCDGPLVIPEAGPYDTGIWNTESGLPRSYISTDITVAGSYAFPLADLGYDAGVGPSLYTADVPSVLGNEIANGNIPWDEQGIYYVFTSAEVNVDDGLYCGEWCGIHFSEPITVDGGSDTLHYAVTGDLGACTNCNAYPPGMATANGSLTADSMVSVMAHEFSESATDPNPWSGWATLSLSEVGDQCNWSFGQLYTLPSGAPYNVEIGSRYFMIQRVWDITNQCTPGILSFDVDAAMPVIGDSGVYNSIPGTGSIEYFGGQVLSKPVKIYLLWAGAWKNRAEVEPIITDFVNNLGSSGWWANVHQYFSETKPTMDAGTIEGGAE